MDQLTTITLPLAQRRQLRRRLCGAVLVGLLGLGLAYAALPWWLPTTWLARSLAEELSSALNRPVHIGAIRAGWISGLVLDELTIAEHPGFPNRLLVRAGKVRCELAPLTMLFKGKVQCVELHDPEIWLVFNEQGDLTNLEDLGGSRPGRLPSLRYAVRRAACHVLTPWTSQTFQVHQLDCQLEPQTGILRLSGQALITRASVAGRSPLESRMNLEARVHVPKLKRDEQLDGDIRVEWENLTLNDLPWPLVVRIPIEQVDGTSTGQLKLAAHADLGIDYDLHLVCDGVRVSRDDFERPVQVPDAELRCAGHWDPNTDTIIMHQLDCQTPAFHLANGDDSGAPAMLVDPNGAMPFAVRLAGRIKDWVSLRREYPQVDAFFRNVNAAPRGGANISLAFQRSLEQDRLRIALDAQPSQWVLNGPDAPYLSADAGLGKRLEIQTSRDRRTGQLTQSRLVLILGDLAIAASNARIGPPPEMASTLAAWSTWLIEVCSTLQVDLTIQTSYIERVVSIFPALKCLIDAQSWRGPLALRASARPREGFSDVSLSLRAAPQTTLDLAHVLSKPAGQAMSLEAHARVPYALAGQIEGLSIHLVHADATLRAGGDNARLEYAIVPPEEPRPSDADLAQVTQQIVRADASLMLPLRVEHIEGLIALLPPVRHLAESHDGHLTGSLEVLVDGRFSYRPGDWLASTRLDLSANPLAVRCADLIDKPAGRPFSISASHRYQVNAGQREQSLAVAIRQATGELHASATVGQDAHGVWDPSFAHASLRAALTDLPGFLAICPRLADHLKPLAFSGPLLVNAESLLIDGRHGLSIALDASDASFDVPGDSGWRKLSGTPARLDLQWQRLPPASLPDSRHVYELVRGHAELAGIQATELNGELVFATPMPANNRLVAAALATQGLQLLESAALDARGQVMFDEALAGLHPQLARWREQFGLTGWADWTFNAHMTHDKLDLRGRLDAEQTHLAVDLGHFLAHKIEKHTGTPAAMAFDLVARPSGPARPAQLDCRELTLDLDGNRVAVAGTATLSHDDTSNSPSIADAELTADANMPVLHRLYAMLPDSAICSLEGGISALASASIAKQRLNLGLCNVDCRDVEIDFGNAPLWVDGRITLDQWTVQTDQLCWAWGRSNGVVSGWGQRGDDGRLVRALLGVACRSLDVADLRDCLARLPKGDGQGPWGSSSAAPTALASLVAQLRSADARVDASVGTLHTPLPLNVQVLADAAVTSATVKDGQLELAFQALVEGGEITGSMTSALSVEQPTFHLAYKADRIQPGPLVDRYLALTFPGMTATGPLTLIDESYQRLLPAPDDPNFETGKGELIIHGGSVRGRAAPLWVTSLFPGLNLATFDFSFMHSWFEKLPIGRIRHQMIFRGRFYNIYMVGYTDADRHLRYEVGIDFLADFDSRYWAESGQGRIPLFTKTGLIQPDGTLTDEIVEYRPRRLIESVLVGNNPLVTAYHAVRKRVLGQE